METLHKNYDEALADGRLPRHPIIVVITDGAVSDERCVPVLLIPTNGVLVLVLLIPTNGAVL